MFNLEDVANKTKSEKLYCRLAYNQVLKDLPILRVRERQLRNMLAY